MEKIITADQIRSLDNLNDEAIKFYLSLAEQRLSDELDTKKQFEQKSFILLSGYITAAIALFGFAEKFQSSSFWFNMTAVVFCTGILPLFLSLKSSNYGKLGRHPEDWLMSTDYLILSAEKITHMYAYTLRGFVNKVNASKESNRKKNTRLNIAVILGLCSVLPFLVKVLFCL